MNRRAFLLGAMLQASAAAAEPAIAATLAMYTREALGVAQEAGEPILIVVGASGCPVCIRQRPIIDNLIEQPEFRDLVVLMVDFDTRTDFVQAFKVSAESTLIAMHGTAERGRATGIADKGAILALMRKAMA